MTRRLLGEGSTDTAGAGNALDNLLDDIYLQAAVTELLLEVKADLSAFADFPQAHWRNIWSTNPQERARGRRPELRPVDRQGRSRQRRSFS